MEVTIPLSKGRIVLRAKDDTYLSVRSYLTGHDSNVDSRYEMQVDERATHERKLINSISTATSKLKSAFSRYNVTDTLVPEKDSFNLTFETSDRMDVSRTKDIQRLCEEYIYRQVVADWWTVNYPEASVPYIAGSESVLDELNKCFSLKPPYASVYGLKYKCLSRNGYHIVLLYKEEMMNEIHTELLKLSRSRTNEKGVPDLQLQTDELEDGVILTRYVNRHVGRICSRVNAYLYEQSNTVDNDVMDRVPVYEFKLVFPRNWDDRLFETLAEEMHSYVVNASVMEWLKSYLPDMASVYELQAEASWDHIKHIVTVRKPGTIYKPLQPF